MGKQNECAKLTKDELEDILKHAGFTSREEKLFLFRHNEGTLEEATDLLNCSLSTVSRIHKRMKSKIERVNMTHL